VNLRILPFSYADLGSLRGDLAEIALDTSHDKWGMDRGSAREALTWALRSAWVKPRGLHMHVSRLRPNAEPLILACSLLTQAMGSCETRPVGRLRRSTSEAATPICAIRRAVPQRAAMRSRPPRNTVRR
jgi:diaminopimelate decarboxylase